MSRKKNDPMHVVPEEKVEIESFKAYPASDDDRTRVGNGEKEIESFHLYNSEDDYNKED